MRDLKPSWQNFVNRWKKQKGKSKLFSLCSLNKHIIALLFHLQPCMPVCEPPSPLTRSSLAGRRALTRCSVSGRESGPRWINGGLILDPLRWGGKETAVRERLSSRTGPTWKWTLTRGLEAPCMTRKQKHYPVLWSPDLSFSFHQHTSPSIKLSVSCTRPSVPDFACSTVSGLVSVKLVFSLTLPPGWHQGLRRSLFFFFVFFKGLFKGDPQSFFSGEDVLF